MKRNEQQSDSKSSALEPRALPSESEVRLQDLIPIVMVIVGGCERCAEKTVRRALQEGCSLKDVDITLRIIANMQRLECFAHAVGADVVDRMEKPLRAGRRSLQDAMCHAADCGGSACLEGGGNDDTAI